MDSQNELSWLTLEEAFALSVEVLSVNGFSEPHARAIAEVICEAQRDECQSHGLYRLIVCVNSIRNGKVEGNTLPEVIGDVPGVVTVDARNGYSLLALKEGLPVLIQKASKHGIAALAIRNCYHFSALWPEVERIANAGMVGLALTPSHSRVAPTGGTKPLFGTNPIAFSWPRPSGLPFVFDFATSAVARGEIELHKRAGNALPAGVAIDSDGKPTTDPVEALAGAMLPFGGHKGSALSMMIELLAGPLIGDLMSSESLEFDAGAGASPKHGELLLAFDPKQFSGSDAHAHAERAESLFSAVTSQGARLPSRRRYEARRRSLEMGKIGIPRQLMDDIQKLRKRS